MMFGLELQRSGTVDDGPIPVSSQPRPGRAAPPALNSVNGQVLHVNGGWYLGG